MIHSHISPWLIDCCVTPIYSRECNSAPREDLPITGMAVSGNVVISIHKKLKGRNLACLHINMIIFPLIIALLPSIEEWNISLWKPLFLPASLLLIVITYRSSLLNSLSSCFDVCNCKQSQSIAGIKCAGIEYLQLCVKFVSKCRDNIRKRKWNLCWYWVHRR